MKRIVLSVVALGTLFLAPAAPAQNTDEVVLAIQPVLGEAETRRAFQPLADFLGKVIGKKCVVNTRPNFLAYWDTMRKGGSYDLILDAAHFTDYRIRKLGYEVLVKVPDSVSYTLVALNTSAVMDPTELVGKRVATLGTPSIGAARLNAMFPNPSRQPIPVEVDEAEKGISLLLEEKVAAAILPTPIVSQAMNSNSSLMVVNTTEPIPHIALSAGPRINAATRAKLRRALLDANKTAEGKQMLSQIGFEKFDPASPAIYSGQSNVLKQYWGF